MIDAACMLVSAGYEFTRNDITVFYYPSGYFNKEINDRLKIMKHITYSYTA